MSVSMEASVETASIASVEEHQVQHLTAEEEEDLNLALANMTVEGNIISVNQQIYTESSSWKVRVSLV